MTTRVKKSPNFRKYRLVEETERDGKKRRKNSEILVADDEGEVEEAEQAETGSETGTDGDDEEEEDDDVDDKRHPNRPFTVFQSEGLPKWLTDALPTKKRLLEDLKFIWPRLNGKTLRILCQELHENFLLKFLQDTST